MKKRILPALLALCMVMSLLPVAFAGTTTACGCKDDAHKGQDGTVVPCAETYDADTGATMCDTCTKAKHTKEGTPEGEDKDEETEVFYCACAAEHESRIVTDDKGQESIVKTCPNTVDKKGGICKTCQNSKTCNACTYKTCTLTKGHEGPHNNSECDGTLKATEATAKDACGAATHVDGCGVKCDLSSKAIDAEGNQGAAQSCSLTKGHGGNHNNELCIQDAKCGAASHFKGIHKTDDPDTDEDESLEWADGKEPCDNAEANTCGMGGCTKPAGHKGDDHANTVCLGANDDKRCQLTLPNEGKHIAGCQYYVCACGTDSHAHTTGGKAWDKTFTAKDKTNYNCAQCQEWNAFVSELKAAYDKQLEAYKKDQAKETPTGEPADPGKFELTYCSCNDCKNNPAIGTVEGETVTDPANPTDPTEPTTPTKAEEFTDMEDWMAADVQVMLDKGWMTGMPEGKFEGRKETTGEEAITVIARMLGADIKGGAEWRPSLNAWIEENPDLVEGIEITNGPMARKDIVLVLWRAAEKPESDFDLGEKFSDVDGLEGDRLTAMKWAAEKEIVLGNGDDTVTPDGNVNRAALAATAARYDALQK